MWSNLTSFLDRGVIRRNRLPKLTHRRNAIRHHSLLSLCILILIFYSPRIPTNGTVRYIIIKANLLSSNCCRPPVTSSIPSLSISLLQVFYVVKQETWFSVIKTLELCWQEQEHNACSPLSHITIIYYYIYVKDRLAFYLVSCILLVVSKVAPQVTGSLYY